MDELDLIERFRANTPESPNARASARSSLFDAMAPRRRAPARSPRRAPRLAWTLAAAALVATIALVAPPIVPGGEETRAAAATLRHAARVAAAQPWTPVGPGEYAYTRSRFGFEAVSDGRPAPLPLFFFGRNGALIEDEGFEEAMAAATETSPCCERELWIGSDGSGRVVQTVGDRGWDQTFQAGQLFFMDLSAIPTDLDALRSYLDEHSGPPTPAEAAPDEAPDDLQAFELIGLLLRETNASPELRAALFEVAATIPSVELVGDVVDDAGRSGIAVGYTYRGERHDLIFDPDTSAVLGERYVGVEDDDAAAGGSLLGSIVYLRSGVVSATDERP